MEVPFKVFKDGTHLAGSGLLMVSMPSEAVLFDAIL
jgi:hypothetical protein